MLRLQEGQLQPRRFRYTALIDEPKFELCELKEYMYCTVLYGTVLHCTVRYGTVLYCNELNSTVLAWPVLSCPVLHCTLFKHSAPCLSDDTTTGPEQIQLRQPS